MDQEVDFSQEREVPLVLGDSTLLEKLHGVLVANGISSEKASEVRLQLISLAFSSIKPWSQKNLEALAKASFEGQGEVVTSEWNTKDPLVSFIFEKPNMMTASAKNLFIQSLTKAGFNSSLCSGNFLIRYTSDEPPTPQDIKHGLDFLLAEIQIIKPRLIVPLGATATNALLGPDVKLKDQTVAPRIFWLGPWAIAPCVSPNYAANPNNKLENSFQSFMEFIKTFVGLDSMTKEK